MLKATLTALTLDSLHDSHPISVEVNDPDEIESIFDAISYSKVGTIVCADSSILFEICLFVNYVINNC